MDSSATERHVLDHGLVRLVDYMGSDVSVVRAARVSYDAAWRAGDDQSGDARLIGYLLRNGHNTPFESVTATFEIRAPIFVLRQWHRHRTQSFNELSARYRELPEVFYVPKPELIGKQSTDNKQMREILHEADIDDRASEAIRAACEASFDTYRRLLRDGVPRELARSVLPTATYSHMFATANLHNWLRFCAERTHEHAQHEIRVYADAIVAMLGQIAPVTVRHWREQRAAA